MLIRINVLLHSLVFVTVVLLSGYGILEFLFISVSSILAAAGGHVALRKARSKRKNGLGALLIGIVVFFWVAYTVKLGLAVFVVADFWVVPKLIEEVQLFSVLPEAYFVATLGYLALIAAVLAVPLDHEIKWTINSARERITLVTALASCSVVAKYSLKSIFLLGIPGVEPVDMGIPFLTGIVTLGIGNGVLFLVNVPVFLALMTVRRLYLMFALSIAFANAAVDLSFGSKETIIFQLVLIPIYLSIGMAGLEHGRGRFRRTARVLLIGVGGVGFLVVTLYKYFNYFRFAKISGVTDLSMAIAIASANENAQSRSSLIDLLNRITGLETLGAVLHLKETIAFSLSLLAFIDGSVVRSFSEIVMGAAQSRTLFSVTQFGYFYVLGGLLAVIIGSMTLGFLFASIQYFLIKNTPVHNQMKLVFLPIVWLAFVSLLLGGGNLILWMKDIVVTFAIFFLVAHMAVRYGNRGSQPS